MSEQEFLSLLKESQGIIYKLVHLYADSEEDKKDLYQEILFQAWKSYPTFRRESKFTTWLYRVCLNTVFTLKRKTDKIEYTDTLQYENTHVTEPIVCDNAETLYKAIRTLHETDRAIISMHLDGYDNIEIGGLTGITANAAGVKLHRIKKQLRTLLNKGDEY